MTRPSHDSRIVERRDHDYPSRNLRGLQVALQLEQRNRPLGFIAVIAAGEDHRRTVAVSYRDDWQMERSPAGLVARMRHAQMSKLLSIGFDIDGNTDLALAHRRLLLTRAGRGW